VQRAGFAEFGSERHFLRRVGDRIKFPKKILNSCGAGGRCTWWCGWPAAIKQSLLRVKMNVTQPSSETGENKEVWFVVVLYDDATTRQRAMDVCDHLAQRFWAEVDLKFQWWRSDFLEDPGMAATAADNSRNADFIVVCILPDGEISPVVRQWFETWIPQREGREGALIDLTAIIGSSPGAHRKKIFLREVAHRAGMDYLTHFPPAINRSLPDSFEIASFRATQVTTILDGILQHSPPPRSDLRP
jgi:hypothetical protein